MNRNFDGNRNSKFYCNRNRNRTEFLSITSWKAVTSFKYDHYHLYITFSFIGSAHFVRAHPIRCDSDVSLNIVRQKNVRIKFFDLFLHIILSDWRYKVSYHHTFMHSEARLTLHLSFVDMRSRCMCSLMNVSYVKH